MGETFSIYGNSIELPDSPITGSLYASLMMELYESKYPTALLVNHDTLVLKDNDRGFFKGDNSLTVEQRLHSMKQNDNLCIVTSNSFNLSGLTPSYPEKVVPIKFLGDRLDIQVIENPNEVDLLISVRRKIEDMEVASRRAKSDLLRHQTLFDKNRGRLVYWEDSDTTIFTEEEITCWGKYLKRNPMSLIHPNANVKSIDYSYTKEGDEGLTYD